MRIIRREDEKVIAACTNNSIYSQKNDSNFEYDICNDYTFSDKRFMNELAKERMYGTANSRPMGKNRSVIKQRLYQDAIEESSRIKTGGYYNQIFEEQREYNIHDTIPGRLKSRADEEKVCQINDGLAFNIANVYREEKAKTKGSEPLMEELVMPKPMESIKEPEYEIPNPIHMMQDSMSAMYEIPEVKYKNLNVDYAMPIPEQKITESPYGKKPQKDIYEDIMNKVNDDLIKNNTNKSDGSTKCMSPDRSDIRQQAGGKANNIPYKKTEIFEKGSGRGNKNSDLVVRDCKKNREHGTDTNEESMSVGAWICSILFMIIPVIGFVVSGIISFIVPKDKAYKYFARVCLTTHMIVSIAAFYLYMTDQLSLDIIQSYINRF